MIPRSLERQVEATQRAQQHWQERHRSAASAPSAPAVTIALAREAGAPGTSLGQELSTRLGWPVYDHELLERIAQEMGLRVGLLESIDERRRSWLWESIEALSAARSISESAYVRHLVETILSLGAHGECIIVGRGAAHLLPADTTLRVRLIADLPDRIALISRRDGLSEKEAAHKVEEMNRERHQFIREHFNKDSSEPHHYDLILNGSRWSVPECADLIVQALRALQVKVAARSQAAATI